MFNPMPRQAFNGLSLMLFVSAFSAVFLLREPVAMFAVLVPIVLVMFWAMIRRVLDVPKKHGKWLAIAVAVLGMVPVAGGVMYIALMAWPSGSDGDRWRDAWN